MSTLPFHPIVQQTPPSPDQAPAVTTLNRDVVLVAGAGAGKTRTLVARILHLLATGAPVRGIVAVTFTLKAAREMRNRLRHEITRYLADPALDAGERTPLAGHLRRPRRRAHRHHPRAVQRAAARPSRRGRHRPGFRHA
jgi:ATP-dependent exoDNAse (exonuclease V) beta subunit